MEDKGYHYILDVILSDINFLKNDKLLETFFLKVLSKTKFNTIGFLSHKFTTKGEGVTGIFLLSESHLSYHTYPEKNYLSIDIYTCGDKCFSAVEEIEAKLPKVQKISHRYIERGCHIPEIEKTKKS
ncbi:adenosylmethionine decarboxylase [Gallibacterium anatis]|uniref:S-adenosylmethionine decarboxylase n=2 Tax=Gallibacterium TaxID=155493 RepID=A0A0A2Y181_9PAST|nr:MULTISPECIES: adenosylmethionine decarboxylase [Gallibacterium]KGQ23388.1 S-adenosylmethionine decarboxylase [Gallibacterium anatis]KGQ31749.1 S-adenosylmethionine decarboxylase [Gallibacterium genomosp. 2]KGQ36375.1 S-adenosylmethionine decarboxylase [Gallibacterium genomosp. 1]KGQ39334.1 S-adenosylmethionine decarboxylase [Gallibacterium anatis IPDH697-78]KGQ50683.1 S-adenosylmethionine decarboxylase [Gallibacterium anatis 10672-6]